MKTYRFITRSHKHAGVSVLALVKRGDPVAIVDAQIRAAGMDPDQFQPARAYDTKTDDHQIAHQMHAKARKLMTSWQMRGRIKQPIIRPGAGPQTVLPVADHELASILQRVLHATTNRDSGGAAIGATPRKGYYSHQWGGYRYS
jgi:hypothetical protein